jgi:hypothetical protein
VAFRQIKTQIVALKRQIPNSVAGVGIEAGIP